MLFHPYGEWGSPEAQGQLHFALICLGRPSQPMIMSSCFVNRLPSKDTIYFDSRANSGNLGITVISIICNLPDIYFEKSENVAGNRVGLSTKQLNQS